MDAWDLHDSLIEASQYESKSSRLVDIDIVPTSPSVRSVYRQCRVHDGHSLKHTTLKSPEHQHESVEGKMLSTVSSKAVSSGSESRTKMSVE